MEIFKANSILSTVIYGGFYLLPADLTLCAFGAKSGYLRRRLCPILDADSKPATIGNLWKLISTTGLQRLDEAEERNAERLEEADKKPSDRCR